MKETLTASIKVYKTPEEVHESFLPEQFNNERVSVAVRRHENHTELVIKATDAVAMRAMFNSVMKSLTVFNKMEAIKNG